MPCTARRPCPRCRAACSRTGPGRRRPADPMSWTRGRRGPPGGSKRRAFTGCSPRELSSGDSTLSCCASSSAMKLGNDGLHEPFPGVTPASCDLLHVDEMHLRVGHPIRQESGVLRPAERPSSAVPWIARVGTTNVDERHRPGRRTGSSSFDRPYAHATKVADEGLTSGARTTPDLLFGPPEQGARLLGIRRAELNSSRPSVPTRRAEQAQ